MHTLKSNHEIDLATCDLRYGDSDTVYIFDFDGVLVHDAEDVLYRLEDSGKERPKLEELARAMKIDASLYATPYLRHLVLQGVMLRKKVPSLNGPLMPLAKSLGARPFFILTARSGAAAVMRVGKTLRDNGLFPQEMFHVGRISKSHQIRMLHDEMVGRRVVFIDDNLGHCERADEMKLERLTVLHVEWPDDTSGARLLQNAYLR